MQTTVVFFSKDNNTRTGAKIIGQMTGGMVIELIEVKKGNFIQAIFKKQSKLKDHPWEDIKDSDKVFLMTPIWASNGTPAMNAFLDKADFKGKDIEIITFQQFFDFKNSDKVHQHIKDKVISAGGNVTSCHALLGGKIGHCMEENEIREQIEKVLK